MKIALSAIFAFALSLNLAAQPAPTTSAAPSPHEDLAAMLTKVDHAVSAASADLAGAQIEKWSVARKTGFSGKSSQKNDAEQAAQSVRQFAAAIPAMIAEVRSSHGSLTSTFKLYNGLTRFCESLGSLADATQAYGRKDEYTRLSADHKNLLQLRNNLSFYVERQAALIEPGGVRAASSAGVSPSTGKPSHVKKSAAGKTAEGQVAVFTTSQ